MTWEKRRNKKYLDSLYPPISAPGNAAGVPLAPSGLWWRLSTFETSSPGKDLLAINEASGVRFVAGNTTIITRLGIKITDAGSAGSVIRFGLWEVTDGTTITLIKDFGTSPGTATGTLMSPVGSAPVKAGRTYFAAPVSQGDPATRPFVQRADTLGRGFQLGSADPDLLFSAPFVLGQGGFSGALFTTVGGIVGNSFPAMIALT